MKKTKNLKERILSIVLTLSMVVSLFAGMAPVEAQAADYSYDATENYSKYTAEGLTVKFTLTNADKLNMRYWTIFLFDPIRFDSVSYNSSTHKLTDSANMDLDNCAYAFKTDNASKELSTVLTATATQGEMDLKGSGKSLHEVWNDGTNWVVVLGPCHDWNNNGGYDYNCDYYIGNRVEIPTSGNNSEFSIYEPLILNSTTLNASTVWASGDREFTMDADGGFFSSDKQKDGALPDDGKITTSDDVPYQLAWTGGSPYADKDSIRFVGKRSEANVTSDPVTMKLSTYGVYDNVYVLGTAGGFEDNTQSLNFSVKLTYADNTTSTTTYNLYDWYKNAEVLKNYEIGYSVFKRLNKDGSTIDKDFSVNSGLAGNGGPLLQSKKIECDETKVLKDITFQIANTSSSVANEHGIYAAIYAVTGELKSGAPNSPSVSVPPESIYRDRFTLEWKAVDGATCYAVDVSTYLTFQDASGEPSFISGYLNKEVSETNAVIEGLDPETTYYCRVRAIGEGGAQSKSSAVVEATTNTSEYGSGSDEGSGETGEVAYEFSYAYDCQRDPEYPKKGDTVALSGFTTPLGASVSKGEWTLVDCGKYDSSKHIETIKDSIGKVVSSLAGKYGVTASEIHVYDLKKEGAHICYGVVCTIFEEGILFVGTTWEGGGGYYICNKGLSSSDSFSEEAIGDTNNPAPVTPGTPDDVVIDVYVDVAADAPIENVAIKDIADKLVEPGKVFSEAELTEIKNGTGAAIRLEVTKIDTVEEDDRKAIEEEVAKLGANPNITYFDASLFKRIGENPEVPISDAGIEFEITLNIPTELLNTDATKTRTYQMLRYHDGEGVTNLGGTFNNGEFTFTTSKFSTYAIVYKDTVVTNPGGGNPGGSNPGGGNSGGGGGISPSYPSTGGSSSGGSTGGSTGGTQITVPVKNPETAVNVTAKVEENKATVDAIKDEDLAKVTNTKEETTIEIDLTGLDKTIDTVVIPKESMEKISKAASDTANEVEGLTIKLSTATVTLDATALSAVVGQADGDNIQLNVDDVHTGRLNTTQMKAVEKLDVHKGVEAYFTCNGRRIGDFKGGEVKVELPFEVPIGYNPAGFSVWYVDDNGNTTKYKSNYKDGKLSFVVDHFSDFIVVYDAADVEVNTAFHYLRLRGKETTEDSIKLVWNTVEDADGYVLYGNKCNANGKKYTIKKIKTIKDGDVSKLTVKDLEEGTYYKYYIKAYKLVDGKKVILGKSKTVHVTTDGGKYGNAKAVKVNETEVTLKAGETFAIKAEQLKKDKPIAKHTTIKFESNKSTVAKVNKNGTVTAKKKGTAIIYVYAQNGVYEKVKVTVK